MFSRAQSLVKSQFKSDLPKALTSYDLLKSLALILMVVDHIGYFFFPDENWFRVIGRLSVPIWFFLIGYADTRKVQPAIWISGLIVVFSSLMAGEYLMPFNILFGLALARLWIDRLMAGALQHYESFAGMGFMLFFLSFPSIMIVEYGTAGMFFAVFGYMRRHKDNIVMNRFSKALFLSAVSVYYVLLSGALIPELSHAQMLFLFGGMAVLMWILYVFDGRVLSGLDRVFGAALVPFKIMGRHSLSIYVVHLCVLRLIVLQLDDDRFGFFEFEIMPPAFAEIVRFFLS